jgi:histidyl-tRNA synthetase
MRDLADGALETRRRVIEALDGHLDSNGFPKVDTPVLEETELFVRKSGGELSSRLYTFVEPGGHRVSLRPEFTPSVIRFFIQSQASLELPVRWRYGGPVFRYEGGDQDGLHQRHQVGAELIGAGDVGADADVMRVALTGLREAGVEGVRLRIGHVGLLNTLLASYDLTHAASVFVVESVAALKQGTRDVAGLNRRARELDLIREGLNGAVDAGDSAARPLIQTVLDEALASPTGRRTPDEIVSRLIRKAGQSNEPEQLDRALSLVNDLARTEGAGAVAEARALAAERGLDAAPFDEVEDLVRRLEELGIGEEEAVVDFGLARGISYYTGPIFELVHRSGDGEVSLGGGGRYDGLVRALGGGDVPALGFAYGVDQVAAAVGIPPAAPGRRSAT